MRKSFLILLSFFCFCSVCLCAQIPAVTGKGSIRTDGLPEEATPPSTIFKTNNIVGPVPTNKWFNSVLYSTNTDIGKINPFSLKLYSFPQVFKCVEQGLLIMYPTINYSSEIINYGSGETVSDKYPNTMEISISTTVSNGNDIKFSCAKLDNYSDFSATILWEGENIHSGKFIKATVGQGFVFSYFEFSDEVYPSINFPYEWGNYWDNATPGYTLYKPDGSSVPASELSYGDENTDMILLKVHLKTKEVFYGIFVPKGTKFVQDSKNLGGGTNYFPWIRTVIQFPNNSKKYMSVALLPSKTLTEAINDLKNYYKFAYNFVTKTTAEWSVISNNNYKYAKTDFSFNFNNKRPNEQGNISGENISFINNETIFCLFPHQYNNIDKKPDTYENKTFPDTLRGTLKIYTGYSFSTKVGFNGIVPFFDYNISQEATNKISKALQNDKNLSIDDVFEKNTYYYGKNLAKIANLIPVAKNISENDTKKYLIEKVKDELINWFEYYSGENSKYFAFDKIWGGLIGIYDGFGTKNYNDHNFHYGYFIYAAAIVAMFDNDFAKDYGGIIKLLIDDIANTDRKSKSFPYMRSFDFYESHCWANGMGGADDRGIDIESSSEAMNAWSAIYLWGLATNNQAYIDLGIYLYSNEYEAIQNYFFDVNNKNIIKEGFGYNHISLGILFAGSAAYNELWWTPSHDARQYQGIQLLPMTSSMLYLGYDYSYSERFYNEMKNKTPNDYAWNDIWTRFQALHNPSQAWDDFNKHHSTQEFLDEIDNGGTETYTYHFIDFFRQNGTLQTGYSASIPSFVVTNKNDTPVFSAYNYTDTVQDVKFYDASGYLGYIKILPKNFMSATKLLNEKTQKELLIFPVPYKPGSNTMYGGDGITFLGLPDGSNIKIFNVAGELVYEKTIQNADKKFLWDVRNNSGNKIASGIYIYYITSVDGTKHKGKLAIER